MAQIIRGFTIVFCPLPDKHIRWSKIGVSPLFIHHHNFGDAFSNIVERQRKILNDPRYSGSKSINIILDYTKDKEIDPTPEEFWEREIGFITRREEYDALGIVFYLDASNSKSYPRRGCFILFQANGEALKNKSYSESN